MAGYDLLERSEPPDRGRGGRRPGGARASSSGSRGGRGSGRRDSGGGRGRGLRRRRGRRLAWAGGLATVVGVATISSVVLSRHVTSPPAPACSVASTSGGTSGSSGGTSTGTSAGSFTLSPDQAQNASIIAAVAYARGLPDHAVTVALATALQESELANLPYGDLDSVGLFQQRPSQGWGTRTQLLDPAYAATAFYSRLVKVPGWTTMAVTEAAQAVQRSAAPDAYAQWEDEARALAKSLTGESQADFACRFDGFGGAVPAPGALQQAMASEMGTNLIGTPLPAKAGWATASWAVAHAYNYHVAQVSFDGRTWRSASGKWTHSHGAATGEVTVTP